MGSVGVVFQVPTDGAHAYLVRFTDGKEAALRRHELSILKHHYGEEMSAAAARADDMEELRPSIIYACVVGSRAYGLDDEGSDTDRRGVYLPPADLHWSLFGAPECAKGEIKQKHAMHLIRLLHSGITALETGDPRSQVE